MRQVEFAGTEEPAGEMSTEVDYVDLEFRLGNWDWIRRCERYQLVGMKGMNGVRVAIFSK